MRTRRSPRNQDRLWRVLGGTAPVIVRSAPDPDWWMTLTTRARRKAVRDDQTAAVRAALDAEREG